MTILETRNLSFWYEKDSPVIRGINIKVEKGSFVGLLGANGCGKTTLIQHLNGLLTPRGGEVLFNGVNLKKLKDKEIFSNIGLVFQNPDDQLIAFTVYEDIAYGVKNLGITGVELEERVQDALRLLDILDIKDREVHKLSFGQKKRTAIAGILAMKPRVLMLDEPTAGLDPMTASRLMKSLKNIGETEGITIIAATHEVDFVPVYCDYVYVMHEGSISLEGVPESVFMKRDILRSCSLRIPRVSHLFEILNEKDNIRIDSPVVTISGARRAIKKHFKLAK
ncbi:MAG: energy-coupling factor ABC transporter ATP-binding protein [Bacillota bacterium]